jgi:hypothetical protein
MTQKIDPQASIIGTTVLRSARSHLEDMIEGFDRIPADEVKQELMIAYSLVDISADLLTGTKELSDE